MSFPDKMFFILIRGSVFAGQMFNQEIHDKLVTYMAEENDLDVKRTHTIACTSLTADIYLPLRLQKGAVIGTWKPGEIPTDHVNPPCIAALDIVTCH